MEFGLSSPSLSFGFLLRGRDFLLHLYALILSVGILVCGGSLVTLGETLGFWLRLICIINLREKCGIGLIHEVGEIMRLMI